MTIVEAVVLRSVMETRPKAKNPVTISMTTATIIMYLIRNKRLIYTYFGFSWLLLRIASIWISSQPDRQGHFRALLFVVQGGPRVNSQYSLSFMQNMLLMSQALPVFPATRSWNQPNCFFWTPKIVVRCLFKTLEVLRLAFFIWPRLRHRYQHYKQ